MSPLNIELICVQVITGAGGEQGSLNWP